MNLPSRQPRQLKISGAPVVVGMSDTLVPVFPERLRGLTRPGNERRQLRVVRQKDTILQNGRQSDIARAAVLPPAVHGIGQSTDRQHDTVPQHIIEDGSDLW